MVRRSITSNNNNVNIPTNSNTSEPLYIGLIWLILLNLFIGGGVLTPPALAAAQSPATATSPTNNTDATNTVANTNSTAATTATPAQASRARQSYSRLPLAFEVNAGQTDSVVRYLARGQGYSLFFTDDGTATLDLKKGGQGQDQPDDPAAQHGNGKGKAKNKNGNQAQTTGNGNGSDSADDSDAPITGIALALKLIGAKPTGQPIAEKPLAATSNYFNGSNPAQWQTGLKNYGQLTYKGVYQGIDLSYTGQQEQLEYQFTVAPGGDVSQIAFTFEGITGAAIQSDGSLVLAYGSEKITQAAPTIYQTDPATGQRQSVTGGFTLVEKSKGDNGNGNGNGQAQNRDITYQISFKITGSYDHSRPLVIDPVLAYSTFIGGSAVDSGQAIKVDSSGNAYVMGYTLASDFPTTAGAYQSSYNDGNTGGYDAFVTKLNTTGTALVYSTYLGGNGIDYGFGLDIDTSGQVYLTGATDSSNFPTTSGAYSTTLAVAGNYSMFVARLSVTGTLNYSTLIGGDGGDYGRAIVVDKSIPNPTRVFVAGEGFGNSGGRFPTTGNALVKNPEGGNGAYDGLLLQLDLSQSGAAQLVYSSYFGGNGEDVIYGLAVDTATSPARFYITGYTTSTNMSVTTTPVGGFGAAYQSAKGSSAAGQDAFVAVLSPGSVTTTLLYSTYLGGTGDEQANGISLDSNKNIYIVGQTSSVGTGSAAFPTTTNALRAQPLTGATQQGFLTVLSPVVSPTNQLLYSTYLGGSRADRALAVATDPTTTNRGQVYVGGVGNSADLPVSAGAFQPTISVTNGITGDHGFIMKLDTTKSGSNSLVYGTHLGGSTSYKDRVAALALDGSGNLYVTGYANSTDFPVTNGAFQTRSTDGYEAFVTKLNATGTALGYSTYLGGGSKDSGGGVAVGSDGSMYLAGQTNASVFPANTGIYTATTPNTAPGTIAYQNYHLYAVRLSPDGSGLLYATYIGGSGNDQPGYGVGLDSSGNFYLGGYTNSADFPTTSGAYNTGYGSGVTFKSVALKLNSSGGLAYSTYFGGNNSTVVRGLTVSPDGTRLYLVGSTSSDAATFPLKGAYQTTYNGSNDAFVAVLNPAGSGTNDLINSTYLGGSGSDGANAVALDGNGGIYVMGTTSAPVTTSFPIANAYQSNLSAAAPNGGNAVFVSKLTTNGSGQLGLAYSTYLGGNTGSTGGRGLVVDSSGSAYVMGTTTASNFPTTTTAYQGSLKGSGDLFVTKFNPGGNGLLYSTYLGGSGVENCGNYALALDTQVVSQVVGAACTTADFPATPTTIAYQTSSGGGNDAVVFKLNTAASGASSLAYSTYLGGSGNDAATGVGVDRLGNIYVGGTTGSNDFPTTSGAYQVTSRGGGDSFASKINQVKLAFSPSPGGGPANALFSPQPVVQVQSLLTSAVITAYNGPITLTIKAGTGAPGAVLSGTTVITAVSGVATFTNLSINLPGTGYVLTARGSLVDPVDSAPFNVGVAAGQPASIVVYSGSGHSAQVSTTFAAPLVAQVKDAYNNPVSGAVVTFTAPVVTASASGTFTGGVTSATATTIGNGTATAPAFNANGYVGSYTVTATVSGVITPASFVLTNTAQPVITPTLVFTRQVSGAVAGSVFVTQPVVTALNPDNSVVTSFSGPVSVSIKAGSGTSGAVLTGTTTLTATAGVVTYTNLAINLAGQNYVLTAASPGLTSTDSLPFTVTAAPLARIVAVGGTPQSTQVNTVFTNSLVAQVFDTNNQPVSGAVVTFQAPVVSGSASGTFTGGVTSATATTDSTGKATAPVFTANTITGTYSVTATVSGVITPASFVLTNTAQPPVPSSLIFNQQPDGAVAGSIFVTQPVVAVFNNDGTPATGFSGPISVSIKPGSGTANALLAGTTTLTATAGVVTYTDLSINLAGQNYVLTAASPGLTSTGSLPFTVTQPISQPVTIIAVAGTPQSTVVSTPFAIALAAQVLDAYSQPVSGAIVTFQAPVVANSASGTFTGGLSSITATTDSTGKATAPVFTANAITGTYSVTATVSGVITPASFVLTNTDAPSSNYTLLFTRQVAGAVAASAFVTQPIVTVVNQDNTVDTDFNEPITLTIKAGTGTPNAVLNGTVNLAAVNGVANHTNLSIDQAGTGYILVATTASGKQAESLPFDVAPVSSDDNGPATIEATGGTPQETLISTPFTQTLQATVLNGKGKPVAGVAVTFHAPVSLSSAVKIPSATFAGGLITVTVNTDANGIATSPALTANDTAGSFTAIASTAGVMATAGFSLENLNTSSVDPTKLKLVLSPLLGGPNLTNTTQVLTATFLQNNQPVTLTGMSVQLVVTGANTYNQVLTTDASGVVTFSYTGLITGTDTAVASAVVSGTSLTSQASLISWLNPINKISTTTVYARFYPGPNNGTFAATPQMTPAFVQNFPTINFNPPGGIISGTPSGYGVTTRPFTDITTDQAGNYTGAIVAGNSSYQAGVGGDLENFNAVFSGYFVVAAAGTITFNIFSDDGFILSIGNGATRVDGGVLADPPTSSPFENLPVVGAVNHGNSPSGNHVIVNFPAPGVYPYELDYTECCGNELALTMGLVETGQGVPPLGELDLSPLSSIITSTVGQSQTFTVTAKDGANNPLTNQRVVLQVNGANSRQINATTDASGVATFTYTATVPGPDQVQALAWQGGQIFFSAQSNIQWLPDPNAISAAFAMPGWLATPLNHALLNHPTNIELAGGITLTSGVLRYWPIRDPSQITVISSSIQINGNGGTGSLGLFDTSLLMNGSYMLDLQATNDQGYEQDSRIEVVVSSQEKEGRVNFGLTDLTVPVAGMPIAIGRTYDSLQRKSVGDFGNGWALSMGNPVLEVNDAGDATLTLLDGRRVTFFFLPIPFYGIGAYLLTPNYLPEAGVHGTLTPQGATCTALTVTSMGYECFGSPGTHSLTIPTSYDYTDPYGRIYSISATTGKLISVTDLDGNVLTFTPDGITSSSGGISVPFERDSQGRITTITDTAGSVYRYSYNSNGDLEKSWLPGIVTPTVYTYTNDHFFLEVKDPRGYSPVINTYYPDGRLATVKDPVGNIITYTYSVDGNLGTTNIEYPDGGSESNTYNSKGLLTTNFNTLQWETDYDYDGDRNLIFKEVLGSGFKSSLRYTTTYGYDGNGNRTLITTRPDTDFTTDPYRTTTASYNENSLPVNLTDPLGRTVTTYYQATHLPSSTYDSLGRLGSYKFDSHGSLLRMTNANGESTYYTYDEYGNKLSITDPLGRTTSYAYDLMGRLLSVTDPVGHATSYGYNFLGQLTVITDALGYTTRYEYDGNGNQTAVVDANHHRTEYVYDGANRLTSVIYPDHQTESYTYNFRDQVLSSTDRAGHITRHLYDVAGRVLSTTTAAGTPDAATTRYDYSQGERTVVVTDPGGHKTTTTYGPEYVTDGFKQRLLSSTDPSGVQTVYNYDRNEQLIKRSVAVLVPGSGGDDGGTYLSQNSYYQYDQRGHQTVITNSDNTVSRSYYDPAGRVVSSTDQVGHPTYYNYDHAGQLLYATNALSQSVGYTYNALGQLLSVTDPNGHANTYTYDKLGQRLIKTGPDGSFEKYTYDPVGNLLTTRMKDGQVNSYDYDELDRLSHLHYADGQVVTYTYTLNGERDSVADGRGITSYTYDNQDRVTSVKQPNNQTVGYTYDALDNRLSMTTPAGTTQYTYTVVNKLLRVIDPDNHTTSYGYDPFNRRSTVSLPNGIQGTYNYDNANRLVGLSQMKGPQSVVSYTYSYDPAGRKIGSTELEGAPNTPTASRTISYTYDAAYRLLNETRQDNLSASTAISATRYTYDPTGNRLTYSFTNTLVAGTAALTYGYNQLDQLLAVTNTNTGGVNLYGYDARGNLARLTSGGAVTTYSYDAANRLRTVKLPNTNTLSYLYDTGGRRVQQKATVGGNLASTVNYLWDSETPDGNIVLETDGSGATQASYVLGGNCCHTLNQLLSQKLADGTTTYYLPDATGSTRLLTDGSGNVTDRYTYDAFGQTLSHQGASTNAYQYGGQQKDSATGLYYLRARYYNPGDGRFVSPDPYEGNTSDQSQIDRYVYAGGDPVNLSDPSGLFVPPAAGVVGSVNALAEGESSAVAGGGETGEYAAGYTLVSWVAFVLFAGITICGAILIQNYMDPVNAARWGDLIPFCQNLASPGSNPGNRLGGGGSDDNSGPAPQPAAGGWGGRWKKNESVNCNQPGKRRPPDRVPQDVIDRAKYLRNSNGYSGQRYAGGETYNGGGLEPDQTGEDLRLSEFDVEEKVRGQDRGERRIVTGRPFENGKDGKRTPKPTRFFYSQDHYCSFIEFDPDDPSTWGPFTDVPPGN